MSAIPQQQPETEIVTGTIESIIDKGGDKWQVAVRTDPTSQYARNLWSSDAGLILQLAQMIGQTQTFLCNISNWTRADGSPVRSLWIQGVGPQTMVQPAQPVTVVQPTVTPMGNIPPSAATAQAAAQPQVRTSDAEREARIHRQTASKVAAILISHLPQEQRTLDTILVISERLVGYYEHGMSGMGHVGDPGPQGVPHGDDDIPY